MKNLKKKVVAIAAATALAATSLTGCAGLKNSDVVATVGDSKITAGVANFYARYQQAAMETRFGAMLGDNMWAQEVEEGTTYEKRVKEGVMDSLQQLYILEDHMSEYEVTLTEEDKAAISKAAAKFDEENELKAKELISAEKEIVEEVLSLMTIHYKMGEAMTKDVNTEVSDEEAAQKSMLYVKFPFKTTDEEGNTKELNGAEQSVLKEKAMNFLEGAKTAADFEAYAKEAGYEATKATFDKDTTSPSIELLSTVDTMKVGEFTEVIESEDGLYVAKLTSLLDREATDAQKQVIVNARKNEEFNKIYEEWKKDTKIKVDEEVWGKISFQKVGVKIKVDDSKPYEE